MSNYDDDMFGSNDFENDADVRKWKLGTHTGTPSIDSDQLRAEAEAFKGLDEDLADLFTSAADMVSEAEAVDWECNTCGLGHGHSATKDNHDIRDSFDVTQEFAERMEFNAACHCGVNELAMLMDFYEHIAMPVFEDEDSLNQKQINTRKEKIRSAASGADIANATANRIESIREGLAEKFE